MSSSKTGSIITWIEGKPYWEQYLWKLHVEKGTLDDADIEKCYQYLLEDLSVTNKSSGRPIIVIPTLQIDGTDAAKPQITLHKIENLKDVNAIDDGCVIEFGKNLTIIYGDNGAGKSGIGRLLSNACQSRKPRRLLPNARLSVAVSQKAKADFHITDSSGQKIINYTFGDKHDALQSFAVFDHESALIHLDSENKVGFVPSKIQIFDDVFASVVVIEEKLSKEKKTKSKENPGEDIFTGDTKITEFFNSLSSVTTDQQIDDELQFTKADEVLLEKTKASLKEKQKQDVPKQRKELQDDSMALTSLRTKLASKSTILSITEAARINKLLKEIREKKAIVDKLSVKNFDFAVFKNIGSPEWRALIVAAEKLHEKERTSNDSKELDYCLLCHQALSQEAKGLFSEYWKFLKSTAESELVTARKTLEVSVDNFEREMGNWPTFSKEEVAIKILESDDATSLESVKKAFTSFKKQVSEWIKNMEEGVDVTFSNPKINLIPITNLVSQKATAITKLTDPTKEIETLTKEIEYLNQKKTASGLIPKVKEYIAWLRWEKAAGTSNLPVCRGNITRKKTEVMEELVMSKYIDIFNEETKKLDCDFGLKVESHGHDSKTVKELRLNFAQDYNPSDILSEGEQTVSALVDFLTEARLDKNNFGIVFDDPVTSLDHLRKTVIAKRLVDESKERQVIVLTHDIAFLLDLQMYAEAESLAYTPVSMRKNGDRVGIIKSCYADCSIL